MSVSTGYVSPEVAETLDSWIPKLPAGKTIAVGVFPVKSDTDAEMIITIRLSLTKCPRNHVPPAVEKAIDVAVKSYLGRRPPSSST